MLSLPRGAPRILAVPGGSSSPSRAPVPGAPGAETPSPELSASTQTLRMLEGTSPLRGFSYVRSGVSGLVGILRGPSGHTPAFCPPPTSFLLLLLLSPSSSDPLLSPRGSVLKRAASYRGAWQRATFINRKRKVFQACVEDLGRPRKSGFCSLCRGEAAAERRERVPRVQPPPPAGSEHREETPGGIFAGDLYKPVERSERKGGRKGGRERRRKGGRERERKGRKRRTFVRVQNPCWCDLSVLENSSGCRLLVVHASSVFHHSS